MSVPSVVDVMCHNKIGPFTEERSVRTQCYSDDVIEHDGRQQRVANFRRVVSLQATVCNGTTLDWDIIVNRSTP